MIRLALAFLLFTTPACALDMRGMLDWIEENSDYETAGIPLPQIRVVTEEDLQIIVHGRLPGKDEVFLNIEAVYFPDTKSIWIRDGIVPTSNMYQYAILHELVHHAQAYSDRKFACIAASEVDAYMLGDKYATDVLGDETLVSDPMVVMFLTACSRW